MTPDDDQKDLPREQRDPRSFCDGCHRLTRVKSMIADGKKGSFCERCVAERTR